MVSMVSGDNFQTPWSRSLFCSLLTLRVSKTCSSCSCSRSTSSHHRCGRVRYLGLVVLIVVGVVVVVVVVVVLQ